MMLLTSFTYDQITIKNYEYLKSRTLKESRSREMGISFDFKFLDPASYFHIAPKLLISNHTLLKTFLPYSSSPPQQTAVTWTLTLARLRINRRLNLKVSSSSPPHRPTSPATYCASKIQFRVITNVQFIQLFNQDSNNLKVVYILDSVMKDVQNPADTYYLLNHLESIDLYYDGSFCPKPLVYLNQQVVPLCDFDFNGMNFSAFFTVIRKIAASRSIVLYYCLPHESVSDRLGVIQNEGDYREFLEETFASPWKKVNMYVDYHDEPLFDWLELESPDEVDDLEFPTEQDEEAEETPFTDGIKAEHQEDAVETKPEPVDDHFLNKLCPNTEEADGKLQQEYPFHNPNMAWDNMVPVIGMQFSNPAGGGRWKWRDRWWK
ncbi:hypothetical protein LXL04_034955 [Taraxacum kok-saghyz]